MAGLLSFTYTRPLFPCTHVCHNLKIRLTEKTENTHKEFSTLTAVMNQAFPHSGNIYEDEPHSRGWLRVDLKPFLCSSANRLCLCAPDLGSFWASGLPDTVHRFVPLGVISSISFCISASEIL